MILDAITRGTRIARRLSADQPNRYAAVTHHVHDGDTVMALVWTPPVQQYVLTGCRVLGVQAPEMDEPGGPDVAAAVAELVQPGRLLLIGDVHSYPRPAHITCSVALVDGPDLATWLLERGYAVPWDGRGKRPTVPWPPVPPAQPTP